MADSRTLGGQTREPGTGVSGGDGTFAAMPPNAEEALSALHGSVDRLRRLVETLDPDQLRLPAYPSEWTVAATLSHLGSAARIMTARLDADAAGTELADNFAEPVWAEWDAKSPEAQAADALAADRELDERLAALTPDERARVRLAFGPVELDFVGFVMARLNEHVCHAWDVEVTFDPTATLGPEAVRLVVDNLELITRFAGRPTGVERDVHVHTVDPGRDFLVSVGVEAVALTPAEHTAAPDLELPAESLIRLVYGRLDPAHTPPIAQSAELDALRRVFTGL